MKYLIQTIHATPRLGLFLGLALCSAMFGQDVATLGSVREIRVMTQEGLARVTVLVDGLIDIKADRVENPSRVFIDFAGMRPALDGLAAKGGVRTVAAGGKLLKQVRVAENQKGVTRLVFDLETSDVEYRTIAMRDPSRLIVELRPKGLAGEWKNPLAVPSSVPSKVFSPPMSVPVVLPPVVMSRVEGTRPNGKSSKLLDPPVLISDFKLPRAEASSMPYRVSGFVLRDFRPKMPPTAVGRMAGQAARPAVAASRMSAGRQSLTRVLGLKIGKVVIDPGHGGHDAGSTGITGLVEKEVTLDIARRLAALLESNLGSEVVLTRNEDVYISPEQRTAIANRNHADLFISIHANSSPLKSASGVETYYLNFTSSAEALEVAARENASSERSVSDLGDLIKKIALKDKIDESREFAGKVQQTLYSGSVKAGNRTKDRGVRKAPFIVLIGAEMPSVLTEIGFLSNAKEEALLRKPEYRQKIAEALFRGVAQYTGTLSHFNVAQMGTIAEN